LNDGYDVDYDGDDGDDDGCGGDDSDDDGCGGDGDDDGYGGDGDEEEEGGEMRSPSRRAGSSITCANDEDSRSEERHFRSAKDADYTSSIHGPATGACSSISIGMPDEETDRLRPFHVRNSEVDNTDSSANALRVKEDNELSAELMIRDDPSPVVHTMEACLYPTQDGESSNFAMDESHVANVDIISRPCS
jgi:hypothetical protein